MANKKKKKISYVLDDKTMYAAGGLWQLGKLNSGDQLGNGPLTEGSSAAIGQIANMAGTVGAGILDNAIPDQHRRINVNKETNMGWLKGAGQGAAFGANPMLAGATGGLSIAAGAIIGGIGGGLISNKNAKKNAQANHDALMSQNYPQSFAEGGQLNNNPNQFGNEMSVFQGNKHEEGGIQLGMNSEVEAGEVKWKDYIFSDQLTPEGSKETFARKAKRIKSKFKGRENDVKANEVLESELSKLAAQNDIEIEKKTTELNKFRNGGRLKYANGGPFTKDNSPYGQHPFSNYNPENGNFFYKNYIPYDVAGERESVPTQNGYNTTPGAEYYNSIFDYDQNGNLVNNHNTQKTGNYDPSVYYNGSPYRSKEAINKANASPKSFKDIFENEGINPSNVGLNPNMQISPMNNRGVNQVKTFDQLPQRQLDIPQNDSKDLSNYDDFLDQSILKERNRNFGYAEAGLLASNIAGVDNLIKSMKPAQTNFDRVNLDRLDLSTARELNARNSALGQRISQANVRNNATSSGQALSTLAASNSALTNQRINADLSTMLQEEQTNNQITNQERGLNNQISREEYIANEQNRANAQSTGNFALSNIGNNFQGYTRDKVLTKNDIMGNRRMMEVLNQVAPNYIWDKDPESDAMLIKYINKLAQ